MNASRSDAISQSASVLTLNLLGRDLSVNKNGFDSVGRATRYKL